MRNVKWGYTEISDFFTRRLCELSTVWKQKQNMDIISQMFFGFEGIAWEMFKVILRFLQFWAVLK